jgi:hypothetical protein
MKSVGIAISLSLLLFSGAAHAGAWTQSKGNGEAILNTLYFSSDGFWDANGDHSAQPEFTKLELNPYLEYGVTHKLTVGANVFLHTLAQENPAGGTDNTNAGLGNSELFARYAFYQDDHSVLSLQPLIALPSAYDARDAPRSGSDSLDAEVSLLGGRNFSLFGQSHYAEARLGYRHRTDGELHDQLRLDAKLGLRLSDNWEIIPAVYSIWSINADQRGTFTQDGQQDFDLLKLEAMARYNLNARTYLQGGGFSHIYGRNVGDGVGLMLSLGTRF